MRSDFNIGKGPYSSAEAILGFLNQILTEDSAPPIETKFRESAGILQGLLIPKLSKFRQSNWTAGHAWRQGFLDPGFIIPSFGR